jgi:hypothetical protein
MRDLLGCRLCWRVTVAVIAIEPVVLAIAAFLDAATGARR